MSLIVPRQTAQAKPTHHQFVTGLGYVRHDGPPPLPRGAQGSKNCKPAPKTEDGSVHTLRIPGGRVVREMVWHASAQAWGPARGQGNRMAWSPEHLSKAGWEYVGPRRT